MMRASKQAIGFLAGLIVGIMMAGGTGYSAELPSGDKETGRKRTQEDSRRDGSKDVEQLRMEGTEIQGTLEKPHVVYVIPWKELPAARAGEVPLRRSFKDEILDPVDRERFIRQSEGFTR